MILALCRSDVDRRYAESLRDQLRGRAEVAIDMLPGASRESAVTRPDTQMRSLMLRLRALVAHSPLRMVALVRRFRRALRDLERRIGVARPEAIVLFEENVADASHLAAAAARRRGIPYLVLPTTIPNPQEAAQVLAVSHPRRVSGWIARSAARCWPQWGRVFERHPVLRLPISDIAALKWTGLDSATPWVLNSGHAGFICVESRATGDIYRRRGVAEAQLVVTGSPVDLSLHEAWQDRAGRQRDLASRLGLDPQRPLMVVAFPPDQYAARSAAFEYPSFAALVEGWLGALAPLTSAVNVVLRPHPRLPLGALLAFERAGCRVVTTPTEHLVALADVYVACISATIRWALALGVPTINYDCYRYRYDDYSGATGLVAVEDRTAFADAVRRLGTDAAYRDRLRELQVPDAARWGCIDGRFADRFMAVLETVAGAVGPATRRQ
ncbi:MAG: hypothetical protein K2Z80_28930 [Xanthobacteraceae bacterium]|nr:hypothetical protein [Xanthobacteraceae bacterium]